MNKFLSRKFILTIVVMIAATLMLSLNKIDGNMFITVMMASAGMYKVANTLDKKKP